MRQGYGRRRADDTDVVYVRVTDREELVRLTMGEKY